MNGVGNLSRAGVKPLRSTAQARDNVSSYSVEALKNGGTMNIAPGGEKDGEGTVRGRYSNGRPGGARLARQSNLSEAEQVEELKKIKKAAGDYEAVFMEELVKAMKQKPMAEAPGGDAMLDIAQDPFKGFLAQAGGLGLADSIVGQVARQEGLEQTLQKYPDVMGPGWQMKIPQSHAQGHSARLSPRPESLEMQRPEEETAPASILYAPQGCPPFEKENARAPEGCLASDGENSAAPAEPKMVVGLVDDAEIAYLYQEATEALG